jgi:hypothetical protein
MAFFSHYRSLVINGISFTNERRGEVHSCPSKGIELKGAMMSDECIIRIRTRTYGIQTLQPSYNSTRCLRIAE